VALRSSRNNTLPEERVKRVEVERAQRKVREVAAEVSRVIVLEEERDKFAGKRESPVGSPHEPKRQCRIAPEARGSRIATCATGKGL